MHIYIIYNMNMIYLAYLTASPPCRRKALEMDEKELDEQPLEPFVPIPRYIGGPVRTGYVPYKLFVIMQLMNLVAWLCLFPT